jgi:hypothetical protein
MKKLWLILPGYFVGLGGLLLITYRTLLAMSSEGKTILVSVNRFGEQYLDVVALVFLWVVGVVGLFCLSALAAEQNRTRDAQGKQVYQKVLLPSLYSKDSSEVVSSSSLMNVDGAERYSVDRMSFSADHLTNSVSVSLIFHQEKNQR